MIERSRIKRIHFVGIGGAGMSGIAEVMHNMKFTITGSDISENETVRQLQQKGISVFIGHRAENVRDAEVLVISSAVTQKNEEVQEALRRKIPVMARAEMLAELMRMKFSIAIAGTHGKTTTTSMIAAILSQAGLDPTYVVGGKLKAAGSGARLGSSQYLVAEADESDCSFLKLLPVVAVITNIENDHLEFYGTMKRLRAAFNEFANRPPFYGATVINSDCPNCRRILPHIGKKVITCGFRADADIRADGVAYGAFSASFELKAHGDLLGSIELGVGGRHNVANALAAAAVALEIGIAFPVIRESLREFVLPERRFQVLYSGASGWVVDDYAHHPSEIRAVLDTLRRSGCRRVIAIFQPHRTTRLKILMRSFASAFAAAHVVIVAPLYTANQKTIRGVTGRHLAGEIRRRNRGPVHYIGNFDDITKKLNEILCDGDAVVFLSAGNLTHLAHEFARQLERSS